MWRDANQTTLHNGQETHNTRHMHIQDTYTHLLTAEEDDDDDEDEDEDERGAGLGGSSSSSTGP
jgi:hypothetical protein